MEEPAVDGRHLASSSIDLVYQNNRNSGSIVHIYTYAMHI